MSGDIAPSSRIMLRIRKEAYPVRTATNRRPQAISKSLLIGIACLPRRRQSASLHGRMHGPESPRARIVPSVPCQVRRRASPEELSGAGIPD